jgi:hypothetical protein
MMDGRLGVLMVEGLFAKGSVRRLGKAGRV